MAVTAWCFTTRWPARVVVNLSGMPKERIIVEVVPARESHGGAYPVSRTPDLGR